MLASFYLFFPIRISFSNGSTFYPLLLSICSVVFSAFSPFYSNFNFFFFFCCSQFKTVQILWQEHGIRIERLLFAHRCLNIPFMFQPQRGFWWKTRITPIESNETNEIANMENGKAKKAVKSYILLNFHERKCEMVKQNAHTKWNQSATLSSTFHARLKTSNQCKSRRQTCTMRHKTISNEKKKTVFVPTTAWFH